MEEKREEDKERVSILLESHLDKAPPDDVKLIIGHLMDKYEEKKTTA